MNPLLDFTVYALIILLDKAEESPQLPLPLRLVGLALYSLIFLFLIGLTGLFGFQALAMFQQQQSTTAIFFILFALGLAGFCILFFKKLHTAWPSKVE